MSNTGTEVTSRVDSVTGGATKREADGYDEETDDQGVKTLGEFVGTDTEDDEYQKEGTDKFAQEVFAGAANSRASGEHSQLKAGVRSGFPVAFVGQEADNSTDESAEHLACDVKGNQTPGKITAGSKADGNSRVDVRTGVFTGNVDCKCYCKSPTHGDNNPTTVLTFGFFKKDVRNYAATEKGKNHCTNF